MLIFGALVVAGLDKSKVAMDRTHLERLQTQVSSALELSEREGDLLLAARLGLCLDLIEERIEALTPQAASAVGAARSS